MSCADRWCTQSRKGLKVLLIVQIGRNHRFPLWKVSPSHYKTSPLRAGEGTLRRWEYLFRVACTRFSERELEKSSDGEQPPHRGGIAPHECLQSEKRLLILLSLWRRKCLDNLGWNVLPFTWLHFIDQLRSLSLPHLWRLGYIFLIAFSTSTLAHGQLSEPKLFPGHIGPNLGRSPLLITW